MANDLSVTALVSVTIEITARSSWSPDTTMAQVHKQGQEDAMSSLSRVLAYAMEKGERMCVVGPVSIKTVTAVRGKGNGQEV